VSFIGHCHSGRDQCLAAQLHVVLQVVVMETIPLQLTKNVFEAGITVTSGEVSEGTNNNKQLPLRDETVATFDTLSVSDYVHMQYRHVDK
jgi:hypothetical protein